MRDDRALQVDVRAARGGAYANGVQVSSLAERSYRRVGGAPVVPPSRYIIVIPTASIVGLYQVLIVDAWRSRKRAGHHRGGSRLVSAARGAAVRGVTVHFVDHQFTLVQQSHSRVPQVAQF